VWIEVFTDGPQAGSFVAVLESEATLIVPVISILEVFRWVLREHSEAQAIQAIAAMQRGLVVDLDSTLAIAAAQLSHAHRLPMADSIILATARSHQARLHTMDADFRGLGDDVELIEKLA
jgi:predicted nucleic acid-binding protein